MQVLATAAEKFCGRWFNNKSDKSLLVIVGVYGNGKTHTARAIYKFCSDAAMSAFETQRWGGGKIPSAIFISWPEASSAFADKRFGLMQDAVENDLVVLDDIGAETDQFKSGICKDKLCQILSRRERKFTVVTTNIGPANWETELDGRINDRLMRNSVIVDISNVPSYATR